MERDHPDHPKPRYPDYPPDYPPEYPPDYRPHHPRAVDESRLDAQAALARRIAEEKAHYERGFPVAGHDFRREREDEWERER